MNWPKLAPEEHMLFESFPSVKLADRVTQVKDKHKRDKSMFKIDLQAYYCN